MCFDLQTKDVKSSLARRKTGSNVPSHK